MIDYTHVGREATNLGRALSECALAFHAQPRWYALVQRAALDEARERGGMRADGSMAPRGLRIVADFLDAEVARSQQLVGKVVA